VVAGLIVPRSLHAQKPDGRSQDAPQIKSNINDHVSRDESNPALGASWRTQQINARKAEGVYQIARLTREIAEIRVHEYEEVTFVQDLATVEGEIKLAKSDLTRARGRLEWARRMFDKRKMTPPQQNSEELSLRKAAFALEQAQSKKKVLVDYTRAKTLKELRSEVEKARSVEIAKKKGWEQVQAQEAELERQIKRVEPRPDANRNAPPEKAIV